MSIRARILALAAGFTAMALFVTLLGLMTISDYNGMMRAYDHAYENAWRGERLNHLVSNAVMETRGLYIAENDAELSSFVSSLNTNLDALDNEFAQWKANLAPEDAAMLAPIEGDVKDFIAMRRHVAQLAATGHVADARAMSRAARQHRIDFQQKIDIIVAHTMKDLTLAKQQASHYNRERAIDFLIACLLGVAALVSGSLWIAAHFISKPLRAVAAAIVRTAGGDYATPLELANGKDELSEVWQALKILKERAAEAERLAAAERQRELKMREILLD